MITADDILKDLEAFTYRQVLASHPERIALAAVSALFECLFLNFRKQYMYIPTSDKAVLADRYDAIWNDFRGHNHKELGIKYRYSEQQIYSIIKQMRRVQVSLRQHDLFPLPDQTPVKPLTLVVLEDYLPADFERAGLPQDEAVQLAGAIADYLCQTYPGISVRITEALWQKRQGGGNDDLFAEAI